MAQARLTDLVPVRQGDARTAAPLDAFARNQGTDPGARALGSPSVDSPDSLVLEVDGTCPDDADPDTPGHQIEVELWMRDLTQDVTGFQAFLRFDPESLTFVSGTYTDTPFDQHIPVTITASGGNIDVSGSQSVGSTPTSDDALLATLVFTVVDECGSTQVSFRNPSGPFVSELSYQGVPIVTSLIDTPVFGLDDTPPVLTGCPSDTSVECDAVPPPATVTATDNCDGSLTVEYTQVRTDGPCEYTYTLTRTWTATDACGNSSSCMQTIQVEDTTAPVLTGCPVDDVISCDEPVPAPADVTATDNCDDTVPIVFTEVREDGDCPQEYTLTRTWTATDDCGNPSSCSQVITVVDTEAPVLSGCPADETVECDAVPTPAVLTATDNCDDDVTVVFDEVREDGPCPDSYTLTRTWTATDDCGNSSTCVQIITVEDTTPPVITDLTATGGDVDGACEFLVDFSASVSDNCCINEEDIVVDIALPSENATLGTPSVTLSPNGSNGYDISGSVPVSDLTGCPATVQVTVFVTDCCGDQAGALATTPDAGRWSESFAGGGGGAPGNVVHAWSDSDGAQWELSGPTLDNVVLVSDTVVAGEGARVYRTEYFGGQLDVNDSLWGGVTGMVTADVVRHVHVTHQIWTGGVVDWAASWTDIVTDAVLDYDRGLIVAGRATFDGEGASVPPGYPPYLGDPSFGGHWGSINDVTLTSVDLVLADVFDSTPPVVTGCPADITVNADAGGCTAVVSWTSPGVTDNCGLFDVSSTHEPGDIFSPGTTPVTYTFTDVCGNTSLCTFDVTVEAFNNVTATIELENVLPGAGGTPDPLQRCMKIVARNTTGGTCASDVHLWVDFTPGTGGVATATVPFEVECGDWDALCIKDEQHTLYDSTGLTSAGPDYAAAATLILPAGDTDDDSDVDINDVTWLMYQWSLGPGPAAFGDCPWDGTRDADFNNDDILDTTDYGILSGNWLTWSTCPCTVMAGDPVEPEAAWSVGIEQLPPHVGAAVDFNGDGVVDYEDVEMFENANGLSNVLSSQLRAATPAKESPRANLSVDQ
jgi:hypothetical protein